MNPTLENIHWLSHASFRIDSKDLTLYIDPWQLPDGSPPADIILITLWTFNVFTPFLLTQGGPSFSTEILPVYVYRTSFQYFKLGYGAAISTVLLIINLVFAVIYLRAQKRNKA